MRRYASASVLAGLDQFARDRNLNLRPILEKNNLDMSMFKYPEQDLPYDAVSNVLDDCAEYWRMPDVGVQLGLRQNLESLGVVSLVARMETSVRAAANAMTRKLYLLTNVTATTLREMPGSGLVEVVYSAHDGFLSRQVQEMIMVSDKAIVAEISGQKPQYVSAEVMHAAPTGRDSLSAALGCTVRYGATGNIALMNSSILDVRLQKQDKAFHPIIRRYLAEASVDLGTPFSERVNLEVFRLMSLGDCNQDKVAAALNMQPRSMQRRLKAEDTSFREIVDQQRRRKAVALVLNSDLPLTEVALAVGYSDQTAFNQAFKRWFDQPPLQMRRRQMVKADGPA